MEDNKQKRYEKPKMPRSPLFWVLVALLGLLLEESYLLDISLIYGLISFLGVVILSQIYIGACRARNEKRKKREEGALDDGS